MHSSAIDTFVEYGGITSYPEQGSAYYFDKERIPVNFVRLIPGHFYTFNSAVTRSSDEIPSLDEYQTGESRGRKPYFDNRPIILSLGQEGPMEVGLNVKLIPIKFRQWFLRKYYKMVHNSINLMIDHKTGDMMDLPTRLKTVNYGVFTNINRSFIDLVTDQSEFNLKFLIDKYTRGDMGNPLWLIDWPDAFKMCTLNYINDGTIQSKTPISYFLTKFT